MYEGVTEGHIGGCHEGGCRRVSLGGVDRYLWGGCRRVS